MSERDQTESSKLKEALKAENEKTPKDKVHYKIFRVEKDEKTGEEKKITMIKFWAKNNDEAYEELKKYCKIANKEYTYYFGTTGNYIGNKLSKSGKVMRYDSFEEMMEAEKEAQPFFKKMLEDICFRAWRIWDWMKDIKYKTSDLFYLVRNKHQRNESWSLDYHLIDDLIYNLPILIKNKMGIPTQFCTKARSQLNKDNQDFDLDKSLAENPNPTDEESKLAEEMWNEELEKGLLYAKLYKFYSNYGIVDNENDLEERAFLEKWSKTIPKVPGTYNEIDYVKLHALEDKYWNSLWNWIKDNGRNLWD